MGLLHEDCSCNLSYGAVTTVAAGRIRLLVGPAAQCLIVGLTDRSLLQ
jgi:hypothetical protein